MYVTSVYHGTGLFTVGMDAVGLISIDLRILYGQCDRLTCFGAAVGESF